MKGGGLLERDNKKGGGGRFVGKDGFLERGL